MGLQSSLGLRPETEDLEISWMTSQDEVVSPVRTSKMARLVWGSLDVIRGGRYTSDVGVVTRQMWGSLQVRRGGSLHVIRGGGYTSCSGGS